MILLWYLSSFILISIKFCTCDIYYDLIREEWNSFKVQYGKTYDGSIEESYRFKIFMANLKTIHHHNQMYEYGLESYKMGINEFTDMFDFEIEKTMCGVNGTALSKQMKSNESNAFTFLAPANINVPDEVNWVNKGAVTEVKNQGHCGSCWAFSSTGSLEGQTYRLTQKLVSLSEQNLIDCSKSYGNHGCQGGMMDRAFEYIKDNNGIDTEESYPYKGIDDDDERCQYRKYEKGASCRGYTMLPPYDEDALKIAVATVGPISVAIEASSQFMLYTSGIFYDPECSKSPDAINHAVLIVGYGRDQTTDMEYWLVKNSWGRSWGEEGYIKMARNRDNNCNIATYGIYPLV